MTNSPLSRSLLSEPLRLPGLGAMGLSLTLLAGACATNDEAFQEDNCEQCEKPADVLGLINCQQADHRALRCEMPLDWEPTAQVRVGADRLQERFANFEHGTTLYANAITLSSPEAIEAAPTNYDGFTFTIEYVSTTYFPFEGNPRSYQTHAYFIEPEADSQKWIVSDNTDWLEPDGDAIALKSTKYTDADMAAIAADTSDLGNFATFRDIALQHEGLTRATNGGEHANYASATLTRDFYADKDGSWSYTLNTNTKHTYSANR